MQVTFDVSTAHCYMYGVIHRHARDTDTFEVGSALRSVLQNSNIPEFKKVSIFSYIFDQLQQPTLQQPTGQCGISVLGS